MLRSFSFSMACVVTLAIVIPESGAQQTGAAQATERPPITAPFIQHVIAVGVRGGYQVIAADVNHDGKVDAIGLSQSGDLVWYENPSWTPHIILSESQSQSLAGLPQWHMVNGDAADLDGDGFPEIALAYGFNANAPISTGNIGILHNDGKDDWTLREIGRVPATHRVRFGEIDGKKILYVAPVLNETETAGLANPGHLPVPLYLYRPVAGGAWGREIISNENMGLVHAVLPYDWDGTGRQDVLTAGFSGVFVHRPNRDGSWTRFSITAGDTAPWPGSGASEIAVGRIGDKQFFATVEHFHGHMVVVYTQDAKGVYQRHVIDDGLVSGHALVMADFDGDGVPEIVAAGDGDRANLFYYKALDPEGHEWRKMLIDNDMAASSCVVADINGDRRPDLLCMDNRSPNYIKWYEYFHK
jgi:hypothetical protein